MWNQKMDEKSALLRPHIRAPTRVPSANEEWPTALRYGVVACLAVWLLFNPTYFWSLDADVSATSRSQWDFEWSEVTPTEHFVFHPCYDKFECARLSVPLDWHNESDPRRAAVAIVKLPAKVPVTHPHYGGAVLINPGGPGGSGTAFAGLKGESMQAIINSPDRKFDIIGFDPRGVNQTIPRASCFPDDFSRQNWMIQSQTHGLAHSNESFAALWTRKQALAATCAERLTSDDLNEIGRHMNTPVVVEDMVAIIERLGEWREKQASELVMSMLPSQVPRALEHARWNKGEEKLLYWGISYGTLLGATFAALHPDRVERIVLDGVVEADDYYGNEYLSSLNDADTVWEAFYHYCYAAGPEKCAAYSVDGPQGTKVLYERVVSALQDRPIPAQAHGEYAADVITYADLLRRMKSAIYFPLEHFTDLARILYDLSQGNGTSMAIFKQQERNAICPNQDCKKDGPWSQSCHDPSLPVFSEESTDAIWCTDRRSVLDTTYDQSWQDWQKFRDVSYTIGDLFTQLNVTCVHWKIRPAWEFSQPIEGTTSHPILWVGNTYDPVTPLSNARKMAKKFPGSVVLQQDCDGHATIAAPSLCTAKRIRDYFRLGELPEENTVCAVDQLPFETHEEAAAQFYDRIDKELFKTLASFARGY